MYKHKKGNIHFTSLHLSVNIALLHIQTQIIINQNACCLLFFHYLDNFIKNSIGRNVLITSDSRKPKRIRTAFSPAQLFQLESAFEKNHYVVGQERKDLATDLNLTETQVSVFLVEKTSNNLLTISINVLVMTSLLNYVDL